MICLALHRAHARVLEEEPIVCFVVFSRASRVRNLVVLVVLFSKVLENAAGFEYVDFLAICEGICYRWDASIGVDFKKPTVQMNLVSLDQTGLNLELGKEREENKKTVKLRTLPFGHSCPSLSFQPCKGVCSVEVIASVKTVQKKKKKKKKS